MGGKHTSALSRETRDLLKENQFFYDSVIKLFDQTALKFKPSDSEAKTEVELLKDGKLAVHVIIPIDANTQADDGRIYLRDTFIFDDKQKQLHEHKRSFEYNGRGENKAEWQTWLEKYKAGATPSGDALSAFAAGAARSFSRPFSEKQFKIFKENSGIYQGLLRAGKEQGLTLRSRDPRSSYAIVHRGLINEVVFTFAMVDDSGKPGNLLVKESFLLDGNTQALVGHTRKIEAAPEVANDAEWQKKAAELNAIEVPAIDSARDFISKFGPDILTDAPEFKEEETKAPASGYANMDQAMFLKTMAAISRNQKAPALSEMDPGFYTTLAKHEAYLAPLREAMGKGFELNLKDPPLKTSVTVLNGKTQVFATYSLKPGNGEAGTLEYSERWTFQNGELTAIDRQAKALGATQGGEIEGAAQRIKEAIQGGKFADAKNKETWTAVVEQAAYLAPHLSYVGIPTLMQNPEAQGQISSAQAMILPIVQEIQGNLIPVLYQNDVEPKFRDDLLRLNEAFLHGDQQTLVASLSSLQKREEAAIKSAKDPEEKQVHEERMRIAEIMFTVNTGDVEKAFAMSKQLVSPAYKKVFAKTLELPGKINKVTEGLAIISKVVEEQIDNSAKSSKGLLSGGSQYSAADKDALQSLLAKSFYGLNKDMKSADPLKILQAAVGLKPDDKLGLTPPEKALALKILNDPIVDKIAHISQEDDRDIQAKEYFELARGSLFEKSLFQSSKFLVQNVVSQKMPKNGASESIDILRTYLLEKSENTKNSKTGALQQMPPDAKAFGSFLKKLQTKAEEDPSKPILTVMGELSDLSDDEKKLVERLKNSPTMQQVNQTAAKTSVKERYNAYQGLIQPLMINQPMIEDAIAILEKDPKIGLKKLLQNIAELDGSQDQYYPLFDQAQVVPEIEQKLAAAVTMPAAERATYYKNTFSQFFINIPFANKAQENLSIMGQFKDDTVQAQAIEGVALAQIVLAAQIDSEMRPQMKQATEYARASMSESKTIQSLLDKALAAAPMNPNASVYTSLKELSEEGLTPQEKELRKQVLEDKTISAILEIGAETDIVKRKQAYLSHLPDMNTEKPEPGTLGKAGYPTTEMWLAQQVHLGKLPDVNGYVEMPMLKPGQQPERRHFAAAGAMEHQEKMTRDVRKFLAVLEGKGDFGSKVGYGMPHFTHELTKPTSILAMAAAPLVGGASQLLVFNKLKNLGMVGRFVAVGVGVGAEATTFTYLHAKGEKYAYGNDAPEKTYWNDLKTNVLLFGAMRGVHIGTAAVSENFIATGRLGKWAGGRVAGEGIGSTLKPLPTKQMIEIPNAAGPGVPQLTVGGERLVSVLNHGGALLAMYGAGQVAHAAGWQAKAPGLDDTFLMYLQAMAGYGITNAATGGRLNLGLADLNMRMGNVNGAKSAEDLKLEIGKLKTQKTELEGEKKGLNDAAKLPIDTKINKIDGKILELETKLEKLKDTKPGTAPKQNDSGLIALFEKKPDILVIRGGENGDLVHSGSPKAGEKIVLESLPTGDVSVKVDAQGKLTVENSQKAPETKVEPKPEPEVDPDSRPTVEPKADTADKAPEPAAEPVEILLNGKPVTESSTFKDGDVVSIGGRKYQIELQASSRFNTAMASVPRPQQLSLARQIAKAKKISDLFKILRDSPYGGAGEVMAVTAEVLSGRVSVESLPVELGLRSKIESLIEGQVKEWKKEGLSIDGNALKDSALPAGASKSETEYHTLRAMLALKSGVEGSRTMYDLLQALGQTSLQTVGGVSTKKVFDSLGLENQRGLLEQVTKAEAELREKIRLADSAIKREKKAWSKADKEMIEVQQKSRDEMQEKADGLKELVDLLKIEVEAGDAATAAGGRPLSEIIQDLPREMGIRQKAQDAHEQAQGDFAKGLGEKEKTDFLNVAKRFFGAGEIDFNQAQSFLRSVWDGGTWQGRMLFNRLDAKQLDLAVKIYFGEGGSRNLTPEQAFRLADAMSQSKIEGGVQVVLSHGEGPARLNLVRTKGEAPLAKVGEAILVATPNSKGKDMALVREELQALCDQATAAWKQQSSESTTKSPNQLSDSQLFFDAETRSYQTWVVHPRGLAKVRVTLDAQGTVDGIQVKYAARAGEKEIGLTLPENFSNGDKTIEVKKQSVDFQALAKELPFELKGPSLSYRALRGATWVGDRIPSLPKFGGKKSEAPAKAEPVKKDAEAKTETKTDDSAKTENTATADAPKEAAKPQEPGKKSSFYSGAMSLLGKLPKLRFGKAKAEGEKVEPASKPSKPTKPAKVSKKKAAAKTEGARPTVPEGLQFPPSQIGSGDKADTLASLEIGQSANQLMGEYHGRTHEGVGRKRNEDAIGMAYTNDRDLVLTAVDGMGGHEKGKEAAVLSLEVLNAEVQVHGDVSAALIKAHDKVVSDLHTGTIDKPGASIGVVKIRRPDTANGPRTMEAYWGGDVRIMVLRTGANGKRRLIYQNAEDNIARQIIDAGIATGNFVPKSRDLAINSNNLASKITNFVGAVQGGFTPRRMREGILTNAQGVLEPATGLERLELEKGDVVLVIPDGTSKNLNDPQVLIDLIAGKTKASEITDAIDGWVKERMELGHRIDQRFKDGQVDLDGDARTGVMIDGNARYMDSRGNVYEAAEGGKAIDHYETDNFSAMVYVENPGSVSAPKVELQPEAKAEPKSDLQMPSDTSLSDPDQTQVFLRPNDSDPK